MTAVLLQTQRPYQGVLAPALAGHALRRVLGVIVMPQRTCRRALPVIMMHSMASGA